MITVSDKHIVGHYSIRFSAGTMPRSISSTSHATISGESLSLYTASASQTSGVTKGFAQDEFIVSGLYVTNKSDQSFNVSLFFDYASTYSNIAIVPPLSTIYVITADNPIKWNGAGFRANLNGRPGSSIVAGDVSVHMVWSAVVKT